MVAKHFPSKGFNSPYAVRDSLQVGMIHGVSLVHSSCKNKYTDIF